MTYTSVIEQNEDGEYFIRIPEELIPELGWNINDILEWVIEGDTVFLRKEVEEK